MTQTKIARGDILRIIDLLAAERQIDKESVFAAVEEAVQRAGSTRFGTDMDIRAHIDRRNGDIFLARYKTVVEEVENSATEISLENAKIETETKAYAVKNDQELTLGSEIFEELPAIDDFGRIAALNGRQTIFQQIREAEREKQYLHYKDLVGKVVNGAFKREDYGNITLELDHQNHKAEAHMRREQRIPREDMKEGGGFERSRNMRVYITDVVRDNRNPQIQVSRTHDLFLVELFRQEVPEIYDHIVEIRAVARDPGSRAKIAVVSNDPSIDPVGACVGIRGIRIQPIIDELRGEKIDVIVWDGDVGQLAVNALAPAEIIQVLVDEENQQLEIIVEESQLSLAIGRKGQNVRLASQLTGWDIDILTEEASKIRHQAEDEERCQLFIAALETNEMIARYLIGEGFESIEDVAYVDIEEMRAIEGLQDIAEELQQKALTHLKAQEALTQKTEEDLANFDERLTPELLEILGQNNICTLEDFADCDQFDVSSWIKDALDSQTVGDLILKARVELGWIKEASPADHTS